MQLDFSDCIFRYSIYGQCHCANKVNIVAGDNTRNGDRHCWCYHQQPNLKTSTFGIKEDCFSVGEDTDR